MKSFFSFLILFLFLFSGGLTGEVQKGNENSPLNEKILKGLEFRSIGPAFMSGRIADIAIDPRDRKTWYVAVGSGGVWKTVNSGTTFTPIFDDQTSYSIGCVTVDPHDSLVIWVGSGENVSGRHVGFGDGVYKSMDGGKTWQKSGLDKSEHIDRILIDPRDSNTVYVTAEGPLWAPGGNRGVYKTTDGGQSWKLSLKVSENTGATDLVMNPKNPDILIAAMHQRRRHVAALVNGGPESGIYKTRDGGKTWKKSVAGLPKEDLGQIGLAMSPHDPDIIYATVETAIRKVSFYRSADGGSSWTKMSEYTMFSTGPHYYQELFACPHKFDRIYAMDARLMVSEDGGKNWNRVPEIFKHGDNHALAFLPDEPEYLLCGSDGGVYETYDLGKTWRYISNLPITQFYKIALDNDIPFYNIVGGTQDNNTQLGPSRTLSVHGIRNSDWIVTLGGDGYSCQIDPLDPNIVYCELQVGNLVRYDKRSGEAIDIQPQVEPGENPARWNWDSPIIISPHSHTRLYFGSQRLYRSDDRGNSWIPISPDLSRGQERLQMKYMDKTWSVDAVWDLDAMSYYGNLTAISESPVKEGLIYCGTDDGLIQVTENGGQNWRRIDSFPGVPEMAFVNDIQACQLDPDSVFAVFDNHKRGDLTPYMLKSSNRGKTWVSIRGDLPDRHIVWALAQDHIKKDLLFAGTEFGIFFTLDGGRHWIKLSGGLPNISFRDVEIQRRENDLVAASFGRGIFILDDYTPLRTISEKLMRDEAYLFPVKKTPVYFPNRAMGYSSKASQGDTFFAAPNPPFGAVLTYYLRESVLSAKENRHEKEADLKKKNRDIAWPGWDAIKQEDREDKPLVFMEIKDESGKPVCRIPAPSTRGFHRIAWDLHYPSMVPPRLETRQRQPWEYGFRPRSGFPAPPGIYSATLFKRLQGKVIALGKSQPIECYQLNLSSLPAKDQEDLYRFRVKTAEFQRLVLGSDKLLQDSLNRIQLLKKALDQTPNSTVELYQRAVGIEKVLQDLKELLYGDMTRWSRSEPANPGILSRLGTLIQGQWGTSSAPTQTQLRQLQIVEESYRSFRARLEKILETDLKTLLRDAFANGVPWTPGQDSGEN
jgi:photosystem II stability/assembly factor-like uncharacterized protein